jgi:hypothetical protein
MGFFDNLFQDINNSLTEAVSEPANAQAMGGVFTQFIRDSGAVWNGDAFVVGLGNVLIGARMRNLDSGYEGIELITTALRPPSIRILRKRGWGVALVPPWVMPLSDLPVIASDPLLGVQTQSDEAELSALAALEPSWELVVRSTPYVFVASDGLAITAHIAPPMGVASVHAVAGAVAALAISSPVALVLGGLADSSPTQGGDLAPSVSLAPDGLHIGVAGGVRMIARLGGVSFGGEPSGETLAQLARAGNPVLAMIGGVATLTWPYVERDPTRLRAGIAALRGLAGQSVPYR